MRRGPLPAFLPELWAGVGWPYEAAGLIGEEQPSWPSGRQSRPEEVIDLGDRVLVRVQFTGTGRTSGAALTHTSGWLFQLSPRGRIAVHDFYWEWQDALEAAGVKR